jgi:hypothetical protein
MAIKTFTTGEVLTASATNEFLANSGLVYVGTVNYTNAATVNVDSVFTSTYTHYRVVGMQTPTNGLADFYMKLRSGGADQSGANYQYTNARLYSNNALDTYGSGATFMRFSNGGIASFPYCWTMDFFDPKGSTPTMITNDASNFESSTAAVRWWSTGGYKANYSADGFVIYPTGGTTWTGSLTVYGYRKA